MPPQSNPVRADGPTLAFLFYSLSPMRTKNGDIDQASITLWAKDKPEHSHLPIAIKWLMAPSNN